MICGERAGKQQRALKVFLSGAQIFHFFFLIIIRDKNDGFQAAGGQLLPNALDHIAHKKRADKGGYQSDAAWKKALRGGDGWRGTRPDEGAAPLLAIDKALLLQGVQGVLGGNAAGPEFDGKLIFAGQAEIGGLTVLLNHLQQIIANLGVQRGCFLQTNHLFTIITSITTNCNRNGINVEIFIDNADICR